MVQLAGLHASCVTAHRLASGSTVEPSLTEKGVVDSVGNINPIGNWIRCDRQSLSTDPRVLVA